MTHTCVTVYPATRTAEDGDPWAGLTPESDERAGHELVDYLIAHSQNHFPNADQDLVALVHDCATDQGRVIPFRKNGFYTFKELPTN